MGVARKWHFSTSGGAANLGGVSGDLSEHRGSGITLLAITSLNRHFYAQIDWTIGVFYMVSDHCAQNHCAQKISVYICTCKLRVSQFKLCKQK